MNTSPTWQQEFSIETTATPEAVWSLFRDVDGWKTWNAGIEAIALEGPFSAPVPRPTLSTAAQCLLTDAHRDR